MPPWRNFSSRKINSLKWIIYVSTYSVNDRDNLSFRLLLHQFDLLLIHKCKEKFEFYYTFVYRIEKRLNFLLLSLLNFLFEAGKAINGEQKLFGKSLSQLHQICFELDMHNITFWTAFPYSFRNRKFVYQKGLILINEMIMNIIDDYYQQNWYIAHIMEILM